MFRLGEGIVEELGVIQAELQDRLRLVMARTERLAVTDDRSGMLRECVMPVRLDESDVRQYLAVATVATAFATGRHCGVLEVRAP